MEQNQIREDVDRAIKQWVELNRLRDKEASLTDGAKEIIIQMIVNIKEDPSPYWKDSDLDSRQRFAIAIIPNILTDIGYRPDRMRLRVIELKFSSWEILHNISKALDKWCPIPKDI